jgi:hypothetical protein
MKNEVESIKSYVNYEADIPKNQILKAYITLMLVVSVPSALFGAYSKFTTIILIPLVIVLIAWDIYLLTDVNCKKESLILYQGIFSLFISISFMIAGYKFASTIMVVQWFQGTIIVNLFIIFNILNIYNILRTIKKNSYSQMKKKGRSSGLILAMCVLGLFLGKTMIGKLNQDTVVVILVSIMIFMSFLLSLGTHNILKYYYIRKVLSKELSIRKRVSPSRTTVLFIM